MGVTVYNPRGQCYGKYRHTNKRHAKRIARKVESTFRARMKVYRCPHCHYWHIGHPVRNWDVAA